MKIPVKKILPFLVISAAEAPNLTREAMTIVDFFLTTTPEKIKDERERRSCYDWINHVQVYNLGKQRFTNECSVPEAFSNLFDVPRGTEQLVVLDRGDVRIIAAYGNRSKPWQDNSPPQERLMPLGDRAYLRIEDYIKPGAPLSRYSTYGSSSFLGYVRTKCEARGHRGINPAMFDLNALLLVEGGKK